jgi:hypothetical protein
MAHVSISPVLTLAATGTGTGTLLPAAFAFGAAASTGWWSLSVAFLSSDGGVYVMCPVAPFGLRMATSVLQQLLDQAEGTAHAWLMVRGVLRDNAAFLLHRSNEELTAQQCCRMFVE